METDRLEFCKVVKKLPSEISIVQHVADRITELKKLYNDVATRKSEKLIHQMLPNYMRRRAMSHNPKRLPLKYRLMHINQMAKSGPNVKKKRPSRKYRRKPRNLMLEYARRSKKNGSWMETHIWHAKRYHMKELWGYKVPYNSTDKRYRASYRAAANHCLIQDISYIGAIEISAPLEVFKIKLDQIISRDVGLSFTAKCYMNGTRCGKINLFKINKYPSGAITKVEFLWRPKESENEKIKTLWIFVHPSVYQEVLHELITLFELQNVNASSPQSDVNLITKNDTSVRNPKYHNLSQDVTLIELRNTLNRFRMTGPFSNAVLSKAFQPTEHYHTSWIGDLFKENIKYKDSHEIQLELWKQLKSTRTPSEIPPNSIINLNIIDPRTNRPAKRIIMKNEDTTPSIDDDYLEISSTTSFSPIWLKEYRDKITKDMMSTGDLCKLRNKQQLVPGIASSFEKDLQPIPILILQRPGLLRDRISFGSGFDLIIPAGYGMSTWLSLVRCGAKSGGWREIETISSEMSEEVFLPDTLACQKEDLRILKLRRDEYFNKPPNKRVNYRKMGITSPFICPWKQLVKEWNGIEDFHVIRNRENLENINNILLGKTPLEKLDCLNNFLIPISLEMDSKGVPSKNGIICIPSKRDIKSFLMKKSIRDRGPVHFEPITKDVDENTRKNMQIDHKKLLRRLRNRRVRRKRKLQENSSFPIKIQKSSTEKIVEEHYERICDLWLPKKPVTIRYQCSRQVIGYVTVSRFVFSSGKVCSLGYLTKQGFVELIRMFQKFKGLSPFVLTRANESKCYNVTSLKIKEIL